MRLASFFGLILVALFALNIVGGCKEEGAAERAGAAMDEAAEEIADELEEAKD